MMDRRKWLGRLVATLGMGVAAVLAVPAAMTALAPGFQRKRDPKWRALGPLEQFPIGEVMTGTVEPSHINGTSPGMKKAVFVWRPDEHEIVVYSRNCTDLSCPLTWDQGSGWFYCPCHGGIFTIEGEPVSGPPSRPMYRYEKRVRDGILEIDLNSLPPMT